MARQSQRARKPTYSRQSGTNVAYRRNPQSDRRPTSAVRTIPSDHGIDAMVIALVRQWRWGELARVMRSFARRLGVPANFLLMTSMSRQMAQYILEHPDQAPQIETELEAANEAVIAGGEARRVYSLDEVIGNLRKAAREYGPTVH
jgi:hypothetical protein